MERKLAKYRDNLGTCGVGIIVFGLWSVIRFVIYYIIAAEGRQQLFDQMNIDQSDKFLFWMEIAFLIIVLAFDVGIRLYTGLAARREAKGRKSGKFYLVTNTFLIISTVYSFVTVIIQISSLEESIFSLFAALLIEITSIIIEIELIVASIQVKRISKMLQKGEQ